MTGRNHYLKNKIKTRMCVACRNRDNGNCMFRIVLDKETQKAMIDHEGKYQGRGAYVCRNIECIDKAQKHRLLSKGIKCAVGDEVFDEMRSILDGDRR